MRCEDCLPLIEEYFDREVTRQTEEQVAAHLSACADCSAALDALSFEQEVYARYDRDGLEVTPDLWARVSAEIARTPPTPESPAAGRPFLSRARDYVAAALAVFAVRPALASSMALLIVAAAAGTLWLARRTRPTPSTPLVAQGTPAPAATSNTAVAEASGTGDEGAKVAQHDGLQTVNEGDPFRAVNEPRETARAAETARGANAARRGAAVIDVAGLLADQPAAKDDPGLVKFGQEAHADDEGPALFVNASATAADVLKVDARPLDPEQKDVARHVERAQMLLRSIKNARASEAGEPDLAYEKNLSRKLLAENATLQLEADVKGDKQTRQVLERIEPFLLEIANMGEQPTREEVRSIRERVRQNEIVAALEVY